MATPTARPDATLDDYLALPEGERAELIGGTLYVTPAPNVPHQRLVQRLASIIGDQLEPLRAGEAFVSPFDVYLPTGDVVQPDVVVVLQASKAGLRRDGFHGAPPLLIEVLSPSHPERDRIVKLALFAENGVGEYWIVDPEAKSVEVFVLEGGVLRPRGWHTGDFAFVSPTVPGVSVDAKALFRPSPLDETP